CSALTWGEWLVDVLFPPRCAACGRSASPGAEAGRRTPAQPEPSSLDGSHSRMGLPPPLAASSLRPAGGAAASPERASGSRSIPSVSRLHAQLASAGRSSCGPSVSSRVPSWLLCGSCGSSLTLLLPPVCERCGAPTAWPVARCVECSG